MNHSEIVRILADRTGRTQKDVKQTLSKIVKSLGAVLGENSGFTIPELGTFGTHIREERKAYSIPDARNMIIPPKRLVYFGPAADLKDDFKNESGEIASAPSPKAKEELSDHEKMRLEMSADLAAVEAAEAQAKEAEIAETAKKAEAAAKMETIIQAEDADEIIADDSPVVAEDDILPNDDSADEETGRSE